MTALLVASAAITIFACTGVAEPSVEPQKSDEVQGPMRWTAGDVRAAMLLASPRAQCIVTAEVGGRNYDPYALGSQLERGPVQLHPRGLLADYQRWSGGHEAEDPWWSIAYLEHMLATGHGGNWAAVQNGRC